MKVAVITVAHGRHAHLRAQERSLGLGSRVPDVRVVVAVDDDGVGALAPGADVVALPTTALGLPVAAARNAGARRAVERGAQVLVFLDVDVLAGPDLVAGYADAVADRVVGGGPGRLWCGPVTYLPPAPGGGYPLDRLGELDDPHPARPAPAPGERIDVGAEEVGAWDLFWSLSFALHAGDFARTGGFCEAYRGYGGEDTDFALLARQAGLGLSWLGSARGYHQHHPVSRPPVEHLDDILRNGAVFRERWDRWPMGGWLEEFARLGLARRTPDGAWVRA